MIRTYTFTCLGCGQECTAPIKAGPRRQMCSPACRTRRLRRLDPDRVPTISERNALRAEVARLEAEVERLTRLLEAEMGKATW